ncbi:unnamed protein product, partial [Polarella glacialis]
MANFTFSCPSAAPDARPAPSWSGGISSEDQELSRLSLGDAHVDSLRGHPTSGSETPITSGSWIFGAARRALLAFASAAGKRKRPAEESAVQGQERPDSESRERSETLLQRSPKRARRNTLEPSTPALSPLGAPFTPRRPGAELPDAGSRPSDFWEEKNSSEPELLAHGDETAERPFSVVVRSSEDFWKFQLEAIYRCRNPYKLQLVPTILQKYKGQEALLYKKVCLTYDLDPTKFYADAAAWKEEEAKYLDEDQAEAASLWGPAFWGSSASGTLLPNFSRASLGGGLVDAFRRARTSIARRASLGNSKAEAAAPRRPFSFHAEQPAASLPLARALGSAQPSSWKQSP